MRKTVKLPPLLSASRLEVVELKPDDVLIFRLDEALSDEQTRHVADALKATFGDQRVLLLAGKADVFVARSAVSVSA